LWADVYDTLMPSAAPHPCAQSGCPALVAHGQSRCPTHTKERKQQADKARPSAAERGYTWHWQKLRKQVLREEPLCRRCLEQNPPRVTPSDEVDHIIPLSKGGTHERSNLQALDVECHRIKSAEEDGFTWKKKS
jgi:5-methylcytosine-specific restriction protein A